VIRRLELADIGPGYVAWFSDPVVRQFIKYAREAPTLDGLRDYWREKDADPKADFLGIFDVASGKHIGNMKFELGPGKDEAHVGFLIGDPASRRGGLLRESLPTCVKRLRAIRGQIAVYLTVDPANAAARAAFERLGFTAAGVAPDGTGDLRMDYRG
jgi:RimJ/RimL family protein N-acetyltransferase